jgi:hypothetical protein
VRQAANREASDLLGEKIRSKKLSQLTSVLSHPLVNKKKILIAMWEVVKKYKESQSERDNPLSIMKKKTLIEAKINPIINTAE